jgi:hypothetical protein
MKNFGYTLDRSSKIILVIAVIGIIASFFGLRYFSKLNLSENDEDRIASITFYSNDVRLKRTSSLDWSTVETQANCFKDDRIFTGPASFATIEYLDGSKVTVQPNSLVSLSAGFVSLNSGSIEVDLSKGQIEVESFGETFKPAPMAKFRVENQEKVKRISPVGDTKIDNWKKTKALEAFVKPEKKAEELPAPKLKLFAPINGVKIPKFSDQEIEFSWETANADTEDTQIEFSQTSNFSPIVQTLPADSSPKEVLVSSLPTGPIYWRLRSKGKELSNGESFILFEVPAIVLQSPVNGKIHSLRSSSEQGLEFAWTSATEIPKVLQVSTVPDFSEKVQTQKVESNSAVIKLEADGAYHWRVGYHYGTNHREWSQVANFTIAPPLEIIAINKKMDFSLMGEYKVRAKTRATCDDFEFIITQGDRVITKLSAKEPQIVMPKLPNGKYEMRVTGLLKGEVISESAMRVFDVRNSPPLQKPTIKNKKKVNLFVNVLRTMLDLLFPSAQAAPQAFYKLNWDGEENGEYEVEVSKTDGTIVLSEKVSGTSYKFLVTGPETYRWRVRQIKGKRASEFSDYAEILIRDKITTFSKPRMISPKNGFKLPPHTDKVRVEFRWQELPPKYTTYLEIYDSPKSQEPILKEEVTGSSHEIVLTEPPKVFYWRVYAESEYKNKTTEHRFAVRATRVASKPGYFTLSPQVAYFKSDLSLSYDNTEAETIPQLDALSGPVAGFAGEYFIGRFDQTRSIALNVLGYSLSQDGNTATELRSLIEYGIHKKAHHFYLGSLVNFGELNMPQVLKAGFINVYGSGRYVYAKPFTEKWTSLSSALLLITHNTSPSYMFRQTFNRKLSQKLSLDLFGQYEMLQAKSAVKSDETETKLTSMGLGLGLTWVFGRVY